MKDSPTNSKELIIEMPLNSLLVLRINLTSKFLAPAIIQPKIDDWVTFDGNILEARYIALPSYSYVSTGELLSITITLKLPPELKTGEKIQSAIRFSGFKDCDYKIMIQISESVTVDNEIVEHKLDIIIPFDKEKQTNGIESSLFQSEYISKILGSFTSLEIIPCKWLVAELIVAICTKGMSAHGNEKNKILIEDLQRTQFYKNGVLVVAGSQLIYWVKINLALSSSLQLASGGSVQPLGILQKWEELLLNLIDNDIEAPDYVSVDILFPEGDSPDILLEKIGTEPEKWFLFLVLGLLEISPRISSIIAQIAAKAPRQAVKKVAAKRLPSKKVLKEKGSLKR